MRGQVRQAIGTVAAWSTPCPSCRTRFGGEKTLKDIDNAAKLVTSIRALGDAIGVNFANLHGRFDWAGPVLHGT